MSGARGSGMVSSDPGGDIQAVSTWAWPKMTVDVLF